VTGPSSGIGKAAAIALAAAGSRVAKVIVAAASDRNPRLRRTAGSTAASISALHRVLPARIFDRIVRRLNRMPS
jgi:NAD(P)-dependent dehydrogenase (short-subunit alcohol dehydrogenase family)